MRLVIDNDFGGDPDGLFQLAHHVLSPSVEIRGVIGSFFSSGTCFGAPASAAHACAAADELLTVMGAKDKFPVFGGADSGLPDLRTPVNSDGVKAIVREAMNAESDLPLFVACGGGLTDIASAWLMEPGIAGRLTLVWIGGPEYSDGTPPPPACPAIEYNLGIDIKAAQVVFNRSTIPLWQVPRDVYRQALISSAELLRKVTPRGRTGEYLTEKLKAFSVAAQESGVALGETYVLGDSPLVLLTALLSAFDPDPSSSRYQIRSAPRINGTGLYEDNPAGRPIRVYTSLDTRLLFEDFVSKLVLFNRE